MREFPKDLRKIILLNTVKVLNNEPHLLQSFCSYWGMATPEGFYSGVGHSLGGGEHYWGVSLYFHTWICKCDIEHCSGEPFWGVWLYFNTWIYASAIWNPHLKKRIYLGLTLSGSTFSINNHNILKKSSIITLYSPRQV